MSILSLRQLSIRFGEHPLLDRIDLQIDAGERICLIGRNGEGKSTLLKIIANEIMPDHGERSIQQRAKVAQLVQEVPNSIQGRVNDIIRSAFLSKEHYEDHQISSIISRLSLDPEAEFSSLSGGLKRRVLFAKALVREPDLLLLDEPTNHLDLETILWLEKQLLQYRGAILFVTHDRAFLQRLANRIVELDRGKLTSWDCDYATYLIRKEAVLEAEEKANKVFDKKLAIEEYWVRHGISARRTRNQGRVRKLIALRENREQRRVIGGKVKIARHEVEKSGKIVIEANNISFSYQEKPLLNHFSTTIMRGDKIGIIGANGCGKTTLLRLLLGELKPQSGTVRHGTQLEIAHFDQLRTQLDESKSVRENVGGGSDTVTINGEKRHIMSYLSDFLFASNRSLTPVKNLSGGEKNRLLLAKLFTIPANVLVLDEPTNDLDIETLEMLENWLVDFQGTILLVSHDRVFLNNLVTSTIVFEAPNIVQEYVGGYDDWLRQRNQYSETTKQTKDKPVIKSTQATVLSYKEKRELESLPALIEKLEHEQINIHNLFLSPDFYLQEKKKILKIQNEADKLENQLSEAYKRWEALDAKISKAQASSSKHLGKEEK